jgi:hypothetical protein
MAMTPLRFIVAGACASIVGIVVAASGSGTAGGAITLAGWLALIGGIHRFGRAGTNES